jgi:hypothetical protein
VAKVERIYRRTHAGLRACVAENSGLSAQYRCILGLMEGDTHSDMFRKVLACYSEKQVFGWLDELQTLGFVESESATPEHDLDFTASLKIAEFLAHPKAA